MKRTNPKIIASQHIRLSPWGAALIPGGESAWRFLKSRINRRLEGESAMHRCLPSVGRHGVIFLSHGFTFLSCWPVKSFYMLSLNQVAKAAVVLVVAWAIVFSERDGSHTPESLKTFQTDRRGYFVSHQGFSIKTRWWPVKTQELKAVVFFVCRVSVL